MRRDERGRDSPQESISGVDVVIDSGPGEREATAALLNDVVKIGGLELKVR